MRFWSCAVYELHLSEERFYGITPRQFDALVKCRAYEIQSYELLFGQMTSWIANTGFRSTEKPTTAEDFMPSRWAAAKQRKRSGKPRRRSARVISNEMERTMEMATAYQSAQVARGVR